ncbi:hypothetical protein IJO12_06585 [bacterium]|nr:hypothetical protein [bacterium]
MIKVDVTALKPVVKRVKPQAKSAEKLLPKTLATDAFVAKSKLANPMQKCRGRYGDGEGPCGYSLDACGAIP